MTSGYGAADGGTPVGRRQAAMLLQQTKRIQMVRDPNAVFTKGALPGLDGETRLIDKAAFSKITH
jgi:hypothetical protein